MQLRAGSVFPFMGNDCLDPPHRELYVVRKLSGGLRLIPMTAELAKF